MQKRRMSTFQRLNSERMNRKQRRALARRVAAADPGLSIVNPNAAGIDVGNASHFAAVPPDRDPNPVREFGFWTADLHKMAEWLVSCGIDTVAMQSTGVYWIPLYDILEQHGLRVVLVNARHTQNVPGRKTDVQECQWLMKLHTYGLLRDSFRLAQNMEGVRTVWRVRGRHVEEAARSVQHMQKALTKMNVQLANVISDISGLTGAGHRRSHPAGRARPVQAGGAERSAYPSQQRGDRPQSGRDLAGRRTVRTAAGGGQLPFRAPADPAM
jgi:transposase